MIKLNNRGQALISFVLLIPLLLMVIGFVCDIGQMYFEKEKLSSINESSISYFKENEINEENINKVSSLIKKNDNNIENIEIIAITNGVKIILNKKVDSIFGNFFDLSYDIYSEYDINLGKIKRIK